MTILGAAGGIGQPLSMLMKMNPLVGELALYDMINSPGASFFLKDDGLTHAHILRVHQAVVVVFLAVLVLVYCSCFGCLGNAWKRARQHGQGC